MSARLVQNTRSAKLLIFLTIFNDLLGFGIIIPILAPISATFLGKDNPYHGLGAAALMTSFSLLQMIFSPIWGRLSDRYGRRPVLIISLCSSTLSYAIFAATQSFTVLLLSRVLAGIGGANITAAQAYIADVTSHKDRTAGMGLIGMAFGLGFALGPVIGGGSTHLYQVLFPTLSESLPHVGAGVAATLICSINLIWAAFKLPESLPPERRGRVEFRRFATLRDVGQTLRHRAIGPLIIFFFVVTFAFSNLEISFSLYAKEELGQELRAIYGLFVFIGLSMAFTQGYLVRKMVKVVDEANLMILGAAILVLGLFMLPFAPWRWILLPLLILSVGQGLSSPCVMSLISRSAGERSQGNVLGTSQSASALARIVGPAFGGVFFDINPRLPFWAAAAIMLIAVIWGMSQRRNLLNLSDRLGPAPPATDPEKEASEALHSEGA